MLNSTEDAHLKTMSTFETDEHVRGLASLALHQSLSTDALSTPPLRGGQEGSSAPTALRLVHALSIEHLAQSRNATLQHSALWFIEPASKNVGSTLVAQRQISGAVSNSKISSCLDIAGVTGSIPVAPTIFFTAL